MSEHMSDTAFGKVFAGMISGMVALTVVLVILAYSMGGEMSSKVSDFRMKMKNQETMARVAPVASIAVGEVAEQAAAADSGPVSGEEVYQTACVACHGAGVAGAPKFGDAAAWEPRIAQGAETLYEHALNGFNAMPAKGGNTSLSDDAVKAAVDYMIGSPDGGGGSAAAATSEVAAAAPAEAASGAASAVDGEALYNASCAVCHAAGVAGAPKFGDAAAWQPRIAQGIETLYQHAINGLNAMPPKGGALTLSDDEIKAVVDHMVQAAN